MSSNNKKFGTMPVFITAISTILGAILFLRFGYAVGNVGLLGAFGIIVLGHLITIPTALAVAELATNQKVEGGGAYYIISRSFGLNIGAAIGIALFLSQAISVAFYIIAFAESLMPIIDSLEERYTNIEFNRELIQKIIGLSSMSILTLVILKKGANVGMKALYFVASILFIALAFFFLGENKFTLNEINYTDHIRNSDDFFFVFTIIFPAFTGIAAGLGLSGDLKNPKVSIPRGTLLATAVGIVIYIAVALKLRLAADIDVLANNQMVMSDIAIWGPIIPIGLACAAVSSALGSIIIAPRTLQALGKDAVFPLKRINKWFKKGRRKDNEPINGSIITVIISFFFIYIGDINFVAQIISMFFILTYGTICLISFLEHFSADPAYRPTFKSRWYLSLLGAVLSIYLMFRMDTAYALLALVTMVIIYYYISFKNKENSGIEKLFKGVIFQISRHLQIYLQKKELQNQEDYWRPFIICVSEKSFESKDSFNLVRWISHKYGFGTYMHYIKGYLSNDTYIESKKIQNKLLNISKELGSRVYIDTIISPSYISAIAQVIQLSGISGKGNNLILFESSEDREDELKKMIESFQLLKTTNFDICVLRESKNKFGEMKNIHIWISSQDYENSNLMILLGYILIGHPDWRKANIKIFSIITREEKDENNYHNLEKLVNEGRLPISKSNIIMIQNKENKRVKSIINKHSSKADLTIIGFRGEMIKKYKEKIFNGYKSLGNIMFVNSNSKKDIISNQINEEDTYND